MKKTGHEKSRDTVPLKSCESIEVMFELGIGVKANPWGM
jgi:hypothetical protein